MAKVIIHLGALALLGYILGLLLFTASWKMNNWITTVIFTTVTLSWIIKDAATRQVRLGAFLPVAILLVCPIGVLWYGVKARGWAFWRPVGYFILQMTLFFAFNLLAENAYSSLTGKSPPNSHR